MPAVLWVFIALHALTGAHTVLKGDSAVWKGRDHQANMVRTGKTPVAYILTTVPWHGRKADREGGCDVSILARVNGRGDMRLNIGGVEQVLDNSWAFKTRINGGEKMTMEAWFIEPIGGAVAVYDTVSFTCRAGDVREQGFVQPNMEHIR